MKLEIDLNKLSMEELKTVIALAEKAHDLKQDDLIKAFGLEDTANQKKKLSCGRYPRLFTDEQLKELFTQYDEARKSKHPNKAVRKIARVWKITAIQLTRQLRHRKRLGFKKIYEKKGEQKAEAKTEGYMLRQKPVIPQSFEGTRISLANCSRPAESSKFPIFEGLTDTQQTDMESAIRDLIKGYVKEVTFNLHGSKLTVFEWLNFCQEFLVKSGDVARYFGVANKFRLLFKNIIVYG